MILPGLSARVGDLRQIASVRRVVLDDGPEAGVRAILFSTGGGLDFMVLADHSLDIGTLHYRGVPVAWQSPAGFRHPGLIRPEDDGGRGFERAFSGFMETCGLDHIRQPVPGAPLHGRHPHSPARIIACGEDWDRDEPVLFCEGEVHQFRRGSESLRLHRRIEAPVGGTVIRLRDRVTNLAAAPSPLALLYHLNLGYPALRAGARVLHQGTPAFGPLDALPSTRAGEVTCRANPGGGPVTCIFESAPEPRAFRLALTCAAEELPYLQLWSDLRPQAGVLALEPCTSARRDDGTSDGCDKLAPGAERSFGFTLALSGAAPTLT